MSFTDYPVTGTDSVDGNTGTGGGEYVVSCGTGITAATLTSALGVVEYVFTPPESRGIFIPAGVFDIATEGTGTVRIERVRNH